MTTGMIRLILTLSRGYLGNDENPEIYQLEMINCISALRGKDDMRSLARMMALGGEEDMTNV